MSAWDVECGTYSVCGADSFAILVEGVLVETTFDVNLVDTGHVNDVEW